MLQNQTGKFMSFLKYTWISLAQLITPKNFKTVYVFTVASFSGNSYMRFVTPAVLRGNGTISMWFTIRPAKSNGIIFYAEKIQHQTFFGLSLKNGYLELRYCNLIYWYLYLKNRDFSLTLL